SPMRALKLTLWSILLWTGLGVFFASQQVLAGAPWRVGLEYAMPRWYSFGLIAPLIIWMDRRFLTDLSLRSRVALHVPLGIAWTLFSIWLRLITRELRGLDAPRSVLEFFLERFYWDTL